jgi:hypothetical protein
MNALRGFFSAVWGPFARVVGWSFSTIEEEHLTNVIPMPGPAHGPVPAIELRREERRKAS